jgi:hypothetical protein
VIENHVQRTIRDPKNQGWDSFQLLAYLHKSQVRGLRPAGSAAAHKFQFTVLA